MTLSLPHDLTVENLLPHRGDMLLVSEVVHVDEQRARVRCIVKESWPLAEEDGVDPLVLIEVAAQTAGICNGWQRIRDRGKDSNAMGWLVGIKKTVLAIDRLPLGSCILGEAENTHIYDNLREVSCRLHLDGQVIAQITLQVFQAQDA